MRNIHIVMHTHWDREWYFTKDETQVLLINHMRELFQFLKEHPDVVYILDGQSVMIDDTLELDANLSQDFHHFVQNKQLRIGPWYTQTDLIIVSGESIMRNLFYGISLAQKFGTPMHVGYAPDTFGHNAQMPQIYRQFDIDATFFWRGFSTQKASHSDFIWEGIDTSTVYGINLATGYQGAKYLEDHPSALKKRMDKLLSVLDQYSASQARLIMNGHDQMPIQQNIHKIIEMLKALYPDDNIFISDFEHYIDEIKCQSLSTVRGDLAHTQQARIHQTISSTRMDIKLLNTHIEYLLYHILEPLSLIAQKFDIPYPQPLIDKALKILFGVHAHDSIGGCNSDEVNADIKQRLLQVQSAISSEILLIQRRISLHAPLLPEHKTWLTIYNLQPQVRQHVGCWVEILTQSPHFSLHYKGEIVEYLLSHQEIIDAGFVDRQVAARQQDIKLYRNRLYLEMPNINGLNIAYIEIEENTPLTPSPIDTTNSLIIENSFYQCSVTEGEICLIRQKDQKSFLNFIDIIQSGDVGDSYDYSPPLNDYEVKATWRLLNIKKTQHYQEMHVEATLTAPADNYKREQQLNDTLQNFEVKLLFSHHHPRIHLHLQATNKLKDSRLRLVFNANIHCDEIEQGIQFGSITAKIKEDALMALWKKEKWHEKPLNIRRFHSYVSTQKENHSFTLFSRDLNEYEYINKSIAFTLWRSFSHLGKSSLLNRPGRPSGIEIPTPQAQLIDQKFTFNMDFSLYDNASPASQAHYSLYPLIGYQLAKYQRFNLNQPISERGLWKDQGFSLDLSGAVVSSFKKAYNLEFWFIRLYNPMPNPITVNLNEQEAYAGNAMEQMGSSIESITLNSMQIQQFFIKGVSSL